MKTAIGYTRVSADRQAEHGASLEVQETKIRAACEAWDYELAELIVETGSGKSISGRPGATRLLELVRARTVDVLVIHNLDRLARNLRDLLRLLDLLEKRSVALVSVTQGLNTGSPAGRLGIKTLGLFAEFEREMISARMKEVARNKRRKGERFGFVPFGLRVAEDGKSLVPEEGEQRTLGLIYRLRDGGRSLRSITKTLNSRGLTTRKGKPWRFQYVNSLLRGRHKRDLSCAVPAFTERKTERL